MYKIYKAEGAIISSNSKTGFVWDGDHFLMNQFLHPFHGADYFNVARSNGLSFWESNPYTFGGSLMWELFLENELPFYDDLVTTSFSGINLGEISYSVSNLIIDESSIGFERFLHKFTSTVINPIQGFNRLVRGDTWRLGSPNKRTDFTLIVSGGIHNVFFSKNINDSKTYLTLRANLNYTYRFDVDRHTKPFDYFSLYTEVNISQRDEFVGLLNIGINYKLLENNYLGLEFLMYERYGDYKYYHDYSSSNTALRLYTRLII